LFGSNVVDLTILDGDNKFIAFDSGDGWNFLGADDLMQLLIDDAPVLQLEDGIVDMSVSGSGELYTKFSDDARFGFETGPNGGFVFTNDTEDPFSKKIMFRNEVDGPSINEFHFFDDRVMYTSPRFEFVDQETGGFSPDVAIDDNLLDLSGMTGEATIRFPGPASMIVKPESAATEDILTWEWDAPEFENVKLAIRSKHPKDTGAFTQNEFHFRYEGMEIFSGGVTFRIGSDEAIALSIGNGVVDTSTSDLKIQIYDCSNDRAPEIVSGAFGFCFDSANGVSYMITRINGQVLRMDITVFFTPFPSP